MPSAVKTLGDRIRIKRFELGLLESQVAASLQVPVITLRAWEHDLSAPDERQYMVLAQILSLERMPI
jgi:DNA-binding transcriptional regulator YiaG